MTESARIYDIEALKAARAALAVFAEEASAALASVDADIQRVSQWLNSDRPNHWKMELRHRQNKVESIKGEIMRKRIIAAPDPASVVLEERRLQRAAERVEEARRRLECTKRWAPVWDREAMMYKGSTRSLTEALHSDIPRGMAILARMMETMEEYESIVPPPGEPDAPPPSSSHGAPPPDPGQQQNQAGMPAERTADQPTSDTGPDGERAP